MASTYSLVLLLLGTMVVTTVVGARRSNMFGYPDYYPFELEEDWFDVHSNPSDIRVGGRPIILARPPPLVDLEEKFYDLDSDLH
ncbi:hypothetical protein MtrunA17_Chr7g0236361 [Medicago truncatula]|uniref:Leguminosin group567 LEED...PEED secreted peptide n=1 Tax=Medicago truncatula TaxID=3880 RepID=A0A072UA29_MEDTR|nr:leguminosin group567 LEED...PEED secreted peptide [Medicago truncatula]RHN45890.1 hypothetical protein MtrunA17_Chr7g0236361 [Medicago truncatula]